MRVTTVNIKGYYICIRICM